MRNRIHALGTDTRITSGKIYICTTALYQNGHLESDSIGIGTAGSPARKDQTDMARTNAFSICDGGVRERAKQICAR